MEEVDEESNLTISPCSSISQSNVNADSNAPTPDARHKAVCWNFFTFPENPEQPNIKLKCFVCNKKYTFNPKTSSNLTKHCRESHPKRFEELGGKINGTLGSSLSQTSIPESFQKNVTYNSKTTEELLVKLVSMNDHALDMVDSKYFQEFVSSFGRSFNIMGRTTMRARIIALATKIELEVKRKLALHRGKFSYTTDIWTSPSQVPFMAITAHYVDDEWKLRKVVIAFGNIGGSHTGRAIADFFLEALRKYDLLGRTFGITLDNASNNLKFIQYLIESGELKNEEYHVRCFAHVLNLCVHDAMKSFVDKLDNLRNIIKHIRLSNFLCEKLEQRCKEDNFDPLKLILDVPTRWNSTFEMVKRALQLKSPLQSLIPEVKTKFDDVDFITDHQWRLFQVFSAFLQPFHEATHITSADKCTTFAICIPLYNALLDHLEKYKEPQDELGLSDTEEEDLIEAANVAFDKLEGYYNKQADVVQVASFVDPRLKTKYLQDRLNPDYLDTCLGTVRLVFSNYKTPVPTVPQQESEEATGSLLSQIYKRRRVRSSDDSINEYIAEGELYGSYEPLEYWKVNAARFPDLSEMARDVLSVQGTSVACERLFSLGKNIITPARNRLKADVVEALMKIKSYYQEWE